MEYVKVQEAVTGREMVRAAQREMDQATAYEAAVTEYILKADGMNKDDEKYLRYCRTINDLTRAAIDCRKRAEGYLTTATATLPE